MGKSIREQTLSGVKWTALESISMQAITFVLGIILARLLNPGDYGILGVLAVFMAVSKAFINSGFSQALIRKKDLNDTDCSTVFYFNIVVSILCYVTLYLSSGLIANFFRMPILCNIVKIYCLSLVLGAFEAIQITKLTIELNFKTLAKINVLSSLASGIIGISMAYLGHGVWALVIQSLSGSIIHLFLIWINAKWKPLLIFSKQSFKELFGFGGKLLIGGIIWQIYNNLTSIIIGRFFTPKDLGNYTRGTQLAMLPSDTIMTVLEKVTYPIMSKIQEDRVRLINVYRKYIKVTSMAIVFALLLLVALAKPIVLLLLTEKWENCIIFLQIYVFSVMFGHVSSINLNLLKVEGRADLVLKLEIYKRIISVVILLASIPFGVIGICCAHVIYTQIALVFNTYYTGKLFGLGYWSQMKDFLPYGGLSFIACIPSYLLSFSTLPNWIIILIGLIISVCIYIAELSFKKDETYNEYLVPVLKKVFIKTSLQK